MFCPLNYVSSRSRQDLNLRYPFRSIRCLRHRRDFSWLSMLLLMVNDDAGEYSTAA